MGRGVDLCLAPEPLPAVDVDPDNRCGSTNVELGTSDQVKLHREVRPNDPGGIAGRPDGREDPAGEIVSYTRPRAAWWRVAPGKQTN